MDIACEQIWKNTCRVQGKAGKLHWIMQLWNLNDDLIFINARFPQVLRSISIFTPAHHFFPKKASESVELYHIFKLQRGFTNRGVLANAIEAFECNAGSYRHAWNQIFSESTHGLCWLSEIHSENLGWKRSSYILSDSLRLLDWFRQGDTAAGPWFFVLFWTLKLDSKRSWKKEWLDS